MKCRFFVSAIALLAPALVCAQTGTTTSLELSASQVTAGTAVQLPATTQAAGQPVSPGQVLFYDGKTLLGTAQLLASGSASVKLRFGPGAHSLTASFAGTKSNVKSTSGAQSLTVTSTRHHHPTERFRHKSIRADCDSNGIRHTRTGRFGHIHRSDQQDLVRQRGFRHRHDGPDVPGADYLRIRRLGAIFSGGRLQRRRHP
jgi:hypothetical protein